MSRGGLAGATTPIVSPGCSGAGFMGGVCCTLRFGTLAAFAFVGGSERPCKSARRARAKGRRPCKSEACHRAKPVLQRILLGRRREVVEVARIGLAERRGGAVVAVERLGGAAAAGEARARRQQTSQGAAAAGGAR